jgi:membrane-bound lytic murein transglycosylase B
MKKLITCIILIMVLFAITAKNCNAESTEAGASAMPKFKDITKPIFDYRIYTLRKFLNQFNSPLTPYSPEFIKEADEYGVDWRMVPAISGVESTFGKQIPVGSYNAYGWDSGKVNFKSWPDSIQTVTKTLKNNYVDKGATSIDKIAKIYAPPSKTWGNNVQYFMGKIDTLPLSFDI